MNGRSGSNSYANYSLFGKNKDPNATCAVSSSPLEMCLVDTMDRKFQHGGIANQYGPRSQKCQSYMAQRCAEKWDGFCEYAYAANNEISPNTLQQRSWEGNLGLTGELTTGQQILQNTAERKYCTFPTCSPRCEKFDPTDPDSPTITFFDNTNTLGGNCVPICRVDPATVDSDPVMDRLLYNPTVAATTLINICNTSKREGTDLSGTKLGRFCELYHENMNRF